MNVDELVKELLRQWQINHSDHCTPEWPHDGLCHWPIPSIVTLSQKEIIGILDDEAI